MKLWLLLGAVLGFTLGVGFGLVHGKSLEAVVVQSCVMLYAGAWLMRWWGRGWEKAWRESQQGGRRHD
ncbi:MAG: hypothetical protein N3A53_07830 [Verrucomicrobiae bacterium]|nr:hypothetical protein [Verrucomicrobiae bacterium]